MGRAVEELQKSLELRKNRIEQLEETEKLLLEEQKSLRKDIEGKKKNSEKEINSLLKELGKEKKKSEESDRLRGEIEDLHRKLDELRREYEVSSLTQQNKYLSEICSLLRGNSNK
jgi:hypothetical protein